MFIKVTNSGPRRYVQLVEAFRDDAGRPKQRTVATLGRLDQLNTGLESVISGLIRVTGRAMPEAPAVPVVQFESARDYGDVWTLTELWNSLGFGALRPLFGRTRHAIDVEALLRVMVFNRLCDPDSKLGVQGIVPELFDLQMNHAPGHNAARVFKQVDSVLILACGTSPARGVPPARWLHRRLPRPRRAP